MLTWTVYLSLVVQQLEPTIRRRFAAGAKRSEVFLLEDAPLRGEVLVLLLVTFVLEFASVVMLARVLVFGGGWCFSPQCADSRTPLLSLDHGVREERGDRMMAASYAHGVHCRMAQFILHMTCILVALVLRTESKAFAS